MTPTNDAPVTVERDDAFEDGVVSLYRFDSAKDRDRAKEAIAIALHRHRLAALTSAPAAGSREAAMVTLRTDDSGRPKVWCDPEIVDLIDALNTEALSTVASCSGHGHRPGIIMLTDGRCLMVFRDREYAKAAEGAYPLDINGVASAPAGDGVEFAARVLWADGQMRLGQSISDLPRTRTDFRDRARKLLAEHPALARPRAAVGEPLPADVAELVNRIGRAEWGATDALDADEHGKHVADSVRITAANFDQTEPQQMQGLYVEGTETVICHVGTSPNSPAVARALAGAWNHLCDLAALQSPPAKVEG